MFIIVDIISTGERCRTPGPEMYFPRSVTHADGTEVRYWSSVIKLPLTSDLFPLNPDFNECIVGTGTKRRTSQKLNILEFTD